MRIEKAPKDKEGTVASFTRSTRQMLPESPKCLRLKEYLPTKHNQTRNHW